MKRFVFDVTTISKRDRPVGIVRTQLELAQWLYTHSEQIPTLFVQFAKDKKSFYPIDIKTVEMILGQFKTDNRTCLAKDCENNIQIDIDNRNKLKSYIKSIILLLLPSKHREYLINTYSFFKKNGFVKLFLKMIGKQYSFLCREDIFVSTGIDWGSSNFELLLNLKKQIGFSFVGACYDVIPIVRPEFSLNPDSPKVFLKYFYNLNYVSDRIFCNSDFSKNEFKRMAKDLGITANPELKTIYSGDIIPSSPSRLDSSNYTKLPSKYVLYVSSLDPRKNHMLLLQVWLKAKAQKIDLPDLVCVGKMNCSMDELFSLYEEHNEIRNHVHFLKQVGDAELDFIYKNSLFCLFPSFIEGWGLGATEALAYGKICIISTADSLREATRGLMPSVDPYDIDKWMMTISELSNNIEQRNKLEQEIAEKFKPKTWEKFAEEFFDFAKGT